MAVFLLVAGLLAAAPAGACMFCASESDPGVKTLLERIEKEGETMVPVLREIAACPNPGHEPARVCAIGALADFGDRESISFLRSLVFELLDPEVEGNYGPWTPDASVRAAAARALSRLEVGGLNQKLFSAWRDLPPPRRRELPRLIGELREGSAVLLAEIVREESDRETVFQAVIQLRRCGSRAQLGVLRDLQERWKNECARPTENGREDRYLSQQREYLGKTIRGLEVRR